jgi:5-(carboxyamino)imidazole ribonucleotide mutase
VETLAPACSQDVSNGFSGLVMRMSVPPRFFVTVAPATHHNDSRCRVRRLSRNGAMPRRLASKGGIGYAAWLPLLEPGSIVAKAKTPVAIVMGSQSDWETMRHAAQTLTALSIPFDARIVSAHRTPDRLVAFAKGAEEEGFEVIIAGAGGAAHLPGMTASMTALPVLGVPIESTGLMGLDALLSIVQMPGGVPVGTLAVGKPGAINAALLAAAILARGDRALAQRLANWRKSQSKAVAQTPADKT